MNASDQITIYEPNYRLKQGFFSICVSMLRNIIKSRELIYQLFKRDFLASYKRSLLGLSWLLISPLVGIVSWVLLNYAGVLNPGDLQISYPAYILIGSSIWGLFMGFYSSASGTLSAGSGFILQVKYPHEALLVKQMFQLLVNFVITFSINIVVLLLFGITPSAAIIIFPLLILPMFFLSAGIGLILSVVNVVATDITNFVNIAFSFIFYLTPIIYSSTPSNELLQKAIALNPLTYIVAGVRDMILFGRMDRPDLFIIIGILSFIFFMFSWRLFYVSEDKVIEKMI